MYACHSILLKKIKIYNLMKKDKNYLLENISNKEILNLFFNDIIRILRDTRDDRIFDILKDEEKELIMTRIFYGEFPKIENNIEELKIIKIFLEFHLKKGDKIDDYFEIIDECIDFLKINFNFSIFNIIFNIDRLKKIELPPDYYFKILEKTIFVFEDDYVKKIPYDDIFKIVDILKKIAKIVNENLFDIQHNSINVNLNAYQDVESHDFKSHDVKSQDFKSHDVESHDVKSHDVKSQDVKSQDVESQDVKSQKLINRKNIFIQLNKFIDIIFPKSVLEIDPYKFDEEFIIKFFCKINCNDLMVRILEQRYIPDIYHFAHKEKILTDVAKKMKKRSQEKAKIRLPRAWTDFDDPKIIRR
ncbi:hypothetical protein DMUE_0977 [Dictyocoela muelleri]|nr:hypothetical protein DMUE_0977 [Dictyocoela muelleri]